MEDKSALLEISRQLELDNVLNDKVIGSFADNFDFLLILSNEKSEFYFNKNAKKRLNGSKDFELVVNRNGRTFLR